VKKLLALLALLPLLVTAQIKFNQLPPPTLPLSGVEIWPCDQGTGPGTTKGCHPADLHDFVNTNYVDLCKQSGIDATGANDSDAAVQTQFAAISNSGKALYINCPIKLTIGSDATKTVFISDNTNVRFGPQGVFIVDNQYIAAFLMMGTQNSIWTDARFQYIGTLGVANPGGGPSGVLNDGRMKTYMSTVLGNTFTGSGSAQYSGPTNACAIMRIIGSAQHITFIRPKFFVADGTNQASYIPVAVTIDFNWTPGTLVTNNNQAINASNTTVPTDINFVNSVMDGFYMGFLGGGNVNLVNPRFLRYSDLQDSSGNNQGGTSQWFAPPHAVYFQMGDPSFAAHTHIVGGDDEGPYVGNVIRRQTGSGWAASLKVDISNGGLVDGWISHRNDSCVDLLNNYGSLVGGVMRNIVCIGDTSTTGSGGGTFPIFRFPSAFPYVNDVFENITIVDNAVVPTQFPFSGPSQSNNDSVSITGLRVFQNDWPAAGYYPGPIVAGNNMNVQGEVYLAAASGDTGSRGTLANQGPATATNSYFDWKIYGWRQFPVLFTTAGITATSGIMQTTWGHSTGTYQVAFSDGEIRTVAFTNGNATPGTWAALTGYTTTAASGTGTTATITFNSNVSGNSVAPVGSTITVAGITPTGYNGSYVVTASTEGTVSYANTTTGAQTVAGTILPFINATAGGALNVNYAGYVQRILLGQGGKATGTRARVVDVSNGWEANIENGLETITWTQSVVWTPAAGATSNLPMTFPTGWSIDRWGYYPQTAFTGPTSINVGLVSGSATALISGAGVTVTDSVFATPASVPSTGGAVQLTAVGSNFTGTGTLWFLARGSQMLAVP